MRPLDGGEGEGAVVNRLPDPLDRSFPVHSVRHSFKVFVVWPDFVLVLGFMQFWMHILLGLEMSANEGNSSASFEFDARR